MSANPADEHAQCEHNRVSAEHASKLTSDGGRQRHRAVGRAAAGRADDERLVTQSSVHPRPGNRAPIPEELHPRWPTRCAAKGIEDLWSHQAEAIHAAWAGPTIVTTGTASGARR